MNYIVVGGVAAGASFACRLRRLDENSKITIFEKSNFLLQKTGNSPKCGKKMSPPLSPAKH